MKRMRKRSFSEILAWLKWRKIISSTPSIASPRTFRSDGLSPGEVSLVLQKRRKIVSRVTSGRMPRKCLRGQSHYSRTPGRSFEG